MFLRPACLALLLTTAPAVAQQADGPPAPNPDQISAPSAAQAAADAFTLDPVTPEAEPAPDATMPMEPAAEPRPGIDTAATAPDLDTPIGQLIANYRTKAVLDRDLPGLTSDENLPKFSKLSLRKFQPMTGGQLTDALLAKLEKDLAATTDATKAKRAHTER